MVHEEGFVSNMNAFCHSSTLPQRPQTKDEEPDSHPGGLGSPLSPGQESPAPEPDLSGLPSTANLHLLRPLIQAIPDALWLKNPAGVYLALNAACCRLIGRRETEIAGKTDYDFFPASSADVFRQKDLETLRTNQPKTNEEWLLAPDGRRVLLETIKTPVHDGDGTLIGVLGIARDITASWEAQRQLRESEETYRSLFDHMLNGFAYCRMLFEAGRPHDFIYLSVNAAFESQTGLKNVTGKRVSTVIPGIREADPELLEIYGRVALGGPPEQFESYVHSLGMWFSISVYSPKPEHFVAVFDVITKRKQHEEQLEYLANYDPLTNLPNRLMANARAGHAIARARRHGGLLAILFLDLDNFKHVNDCFGHHVGDLLLREAAWRLKGRVREEDTLARMGGDEIVVLMESLSREEDAAILADNLNAALHAPFSIDGREFFVTASIGIALYPRDGEDIETLLSHADAALYRAKSDGRDRFCFYTSDLTVEATERLLLEADLHRAIERQEFVVYYQPLLDLQTDTVVGVEALVRWCHPEKGLVAPAGFIRLAETTGLIIPLGAWVLNEACRQMRDWRERGVSISRLAVNLAGAQILRDNVPALVRRTLAEHDLPSHCLTLEVSETFIMDEGQNGYDILCKLRELGVKLAIDDFGTGHSSLAYLKRLPINELKIDRAFVDGLPEDSNDAAITRAIIAMASSLGLEILAEGIETEAQRRYLTDLGCHRGQGYLFGRPMTAADLERHLARTAGERDQ
jgi:diguanylate cyclase (GGDEF)-like protein/PAS domain S-box-containing protein